MYCGGKVDLIGMFSVCLLNDYGLGNQLTKVVHCKLCKDFLVDELRLFRMQMHKPQGIFKFAKRCFNVPAHCIQFLEKQAVQLLPFQMAVFWFS